MVDFALFRAQVNEREQNIMIQNTLDGKVIYNFLYDKIF